MCDELTFEILIEAVAGKAAAFRCRTQLQPAGGRRRQGFSTDVCRSGLRHGAAPTSWQGRSRRLRAARLGTVTGQPDGRSASASHR